MKALLLTFVVALFTNNITPFKNIENFQSNIQISENKEFNYQNILQNLKQSIIINKKNISINKNKINKSIWPQELYSLITNNDYQIWLQSMYEQNRLSFISEFFINDEQNPEVMQAWAEYYWYWFGYWRLHLTKEECDSVYNVLQKSSDVMSVIGDFLENSGFAISKLLITRVVSAIVSLISNDWLTTNGLTIHFVTLIPVYFERK